MRHLKQSCASLIVGLYLSLMANAQDVPTVVEARSLVATYFDSLGRGDTATIKTVLGGEFLASRRTLLDNPLYANLLSNRYSSATTTILGAQTTPAGTVTVDAQIAFSADESFRLRFVVAYNADGTLRIMSESE